MKLIRQGRLERSFQSWLPVAIAFVATLGSLANPLEHWTQRLPTDLGPLYSRIVYGSGVYVSVGEAGRVRISSDTTNWVAVPTPTTANLAQVVYANGKFVAVGSGGTILTSSNALDWSLRDLGTNAFLQAVTFGGGKFVAVGFYYAAVSNDGEFWTPAIVPPIAYCTDIVYGNDVFVTPNNGGGTWSSNDGLTWRSDSSAGWSGSKQIAFGNGVFVLAVGNSAPYPLYTSLDGTKWRRAAQQLNGGVSTICFGNGIFVGSGGFYLSGDGTNWFATGAGVPGNLSYANGQFLAPWPPSGQLGISSDGLNWEKVRYSAPTLGAIAHVDGAFVALGAIGARSTNGFDWMIGSTPTRYVTSPAYGNGVYVATDSSQIVTSTNGLDWTVPSANNHWPSGGAAFGNGWFVAYDAGDGFLKRSVDGTNWIPALAAANGANGIAFGNDHFVVAQRDGALLVSSNALDWSTNYLETPDSVLRISHANGMFFAGTRSSSGILVWTSYTSTNGFEWARHPAGPDGVPTGNKIVYSNGLFVSPADVDYGGGMLVSSNGRDWTAVRGQYSSSIIGVASDGQTAVGVTRGGLLQSESFEPSAPMILAQPKDRVVITGNSALFDVSASGSTPLVYQWFKEGVLISDRTNAQLLISDAQPADAGTYSVVVSNAYGTVTSELASLTVTSSSPLLITTQPQGRSMSLGETAYFGVAAQPRSSLSYQWMKNGEPIHGATNLALTFLIFYESDAGDYSVVVSNGEATVTSEVAVLSVTQPARPYIRFQPQSLIVTNGGTAIFEVDAVGAEPLLYQWQNDSTGILGATNRTLILTNVQPGQANGYSVTIRNASGAARSERAILTVHSLPVLNQPPKSLNVAVGVPIKLPAEGHWSIVPAPEAQWFKNGQAIPFATNFSLMIPAARPSDAGVYVLTLSNIVGSISTEPVTVTVFPVGPLDHWRKVGQLPTGIALSSVLWAEDAFRAVGYFSMATSSNGVDWSGGYFAGPITKSFYDIAYGGGQLVAVGGGSGIAFTFAGAPDAWFHTQAPIKGVLEGVTYGNDLFVAVGVQDVVTSVNGEDWVARTNNSVSAVDVAFGNGRFVAVGHGGMATSADGIAWTDSVLPASVVSPPGFSSVAYGNGRFVATGYSNELILNSDDGITWRVVNLKAPSRIGKVVFGDGVFLGTGDGLFSSIDGEEWVRRNDGLNIPLSAGFSYSGIIVFGAGRFFQIDYRNDVYVADPVISVEARYGERPEVLVWSMIGRSCRIESATSLDANANWEPVGTMELETYPATWSDSRPASGEQRFYRAVLLPPE